MQSASFSLKSLSKLALNGLKSFGTTAINALGGMAIFAGISFAVSGVAKLANKLIVTKKELEEMRQEIKNIGTIMQSQGTLSTDEYEEFLELGNQIAKIFTSLKIGTTESGDTILILPRNIVTITYNELLTY